MLWYTLENGKLCLGTGESEYANFHVVTSVTMKKPIKTPLTENHINVIGTYPEDWYNDESIENKIDSAAKHFFAQTDTDHVAA